MECCFVLLQHAVPSWLFWPPLRLLISVYAINVIDKCLPFPSHQHFIQMTKLVCKIYQLLAQKQNGKFSYHWITTNLKSHTIATSDCFSQKCKMTITFFFLTFNISLHYWFYKQMTSVSMTLANFILLTKLARKLYWLFAQKQNVKNFISLRYLIVYWNCTQLRYQTIFVRSWNWPYGEVVVIVVSTDIVPY